MIYLDYSATTPVNKEVLETFNRVSLEYPGNANSLHFLGMETKKVMDKSTEMVANLLKVKKDEVIFTSSASESNNMALKGIAFQYQNRGHHIITTKLEHSSILETVSYLESIGYEISYVKVNDDGQVDIDDLKQLIRKDTVLVSICEVNSEVGIKQDIEKLSKVIKEKNPLCFFHVDGTQAVGKIKVDLSKVDLYTFSAHKFYGLKGIACLIKKQNVSLVPLIHGGKSQSDFRSSTPAVPLMASLAKALRLSYDDFDLKYELVLKLNQKLRKELENLSEVVINSNSYSIPHIMNISIIGIKPETMLHRMEMDQIYISTKTACSKDNSDSLSLTVMKKEKKITSSAIRISLSYLTTEDEIDELIRTLKKAIQELNFKNEARK